MERKTPLKRTPMKRGEAKIAPVSKTKKRRREQREGPSMADLRPILLRRCGGRCERCGHVTGNFFEAHHRQFRSRGGRDEIVNLVALCKRCHDWVHANDIKARREGFSLSAYRFPAFAPINQPLGLPVYLTHEGTYSRKAPLPEGLIEIPKEEQ